MGTGTHAGRRRRGHARENAVGRLRSTDTRPTSSPSRPGQEARPMSDLQASVTIRRPIADVFAFGSDARNIPHWHADTAEVHLLSGDGRQAGSRVLDVIRTGNGRRMEAVVEITRHEPDRLWAFSADL